MEGIFFSVFPHFWRRRFLSVFCINSSIHIFLNFDSFVAPFITNITHSIKRGMEYLAPIIEERRRLLDKYGDEWVDKPVSRSHLLL